MAIAVYERYDCGVKGTELCRVAVVAGAAFAAVSAGAADLSETLDRIYQEHNVQTELPRTEPPPSDATVAFRGAPWLLAVLIAVVLAALLAAWAASVDWERLRERKRARQRTGPADGGGGADGQDWLGHADACARQGRHAEAIHALLLGALGALTPTQRWSPAATPREIAAAHLRVPDLLTLVSAAELAHFGGRPASADEYSACRARAVRLRHGMAEQPNPLRKQAEGAGGSDASAPPARD